MNQKRNVQEYEKAIQYIYELMKEGILTIGSRLPTERAIAEKLGIGRNSTREALSIMHGMGLIESRQGSGNYISRELGAKRHHNAIIMASTGFFLSFFFGCLFTKDLRGLGESE